MEADYIILYFCCLVTDMNHVTSHRIRNCLVGHYGNLWGLKPEAVREVKVLLFNSLAFCILRSEMSALVTISDVQNYKGVNEYTGEILFCGYSRCRHMYGLDLYFGCLWGRRSLMPHMESDFLLNKIFDFQMLNLPYFSRNKSKLLRMCYLLLYIVGFTWLIFLLLFCVYVQVGLFILFSIFHF